MVPLLIPVDHVPPEPDWVALAKLVELHTTVAKSDGAEPGELHMAMLLERGGPAGLSPDDHAWCSAIEAVVGNRHGVDCSVHVRNGPAAVRSSLGEHGLRPEQRSAAVTCVKKERRDFLLAARDRDRRRLLPNHIPK